MIQSTKGIVLRTVKYGETSVICTIYTEAFGLQSYLVNGVRVSSKKGSAKYSMFQPAAILELVAYHSDFKNLQRLKEYRWDVMYQNIYADVIKHSVALFMVELFMKSLKQPESNAELFYFVEDAFRHLDEAPPSITANYPLFFALHLPVFFGFAPLPPKGDHSYFFDIREGQFTMEQPTHSHYLYEDDASIVADILRIRKPIELEHITMNQEKRRRILFALEEFYRFHIEDFPALKTLPVLRELMN